MSDEDTPGPEDSDGSDPPPASDPDALPPRGQRGGTRKPPSEPFYSALWVAYRDGLRGKNALKKKFHCGWWVINEAIENGWPSLGWPSLRSRYELYEKQTAAERRKALAQDSGVAIARADAKAAQASGQIDQQTWSAFKPRATKAVLEGYEALEQLAAKLREASKAASFVNYRTIRTRDAQSGRVIYTEQAFVDGLRVAQAVRLWAGAAKEAGTLMSFLVGGPSERTEVMPALTPEQVAEIREGRLPEGVTVEQVAQAVLALGQVAVGGGSG